MFQQIQIGDLSLNDLDNEANQVETNKPIGM